ncbi:MAG: extensin-like protein [Myxococcaceae bacterium]
MKKAFEQNVSRAKPRLRLGAMVSTVVEPEPTPEPAPVAADLASTLKAKVERANGPKPTAAEAMQRALDGVAHEMVEHIAASVAAEPPAAVRAKGATVRAQADAPRGRGQADWTEGGRAVADSRVTARGGQVARAESADPRSPESASHAQVALRGSQTSPAAAQEQVAHRGFDSVSVARAAASQEHFAPSSSESSTVARTAASRSEVVQGAAFTLDASARIEARAESSFDSDLVARNSPEASMPSPIKTLVSASVVAAMEPPNHMVEVQTEAPPSPAQLEELSPDVRRERLKERLKAVRENPRPEPLPATVAETGIRAVERISVLQTEVGKLKALNLALTQDLEAARRTAEKATEEARSRMEEARRLTQQMEERARLLSELERELQSLEGERDESLLKLQEARQSLDASAKEKESLNAEIAKRDAALQESLSEEEKLAADLEAAHEDASTLRRGLDAVTVERDTLARQVSELTAERAELMEARRALEAVHRALANAAAR